MDHFVWPGCQLGQVGIWIRGSIRLSWRIVSASDYEGAENAQSRLNLFRARHGVMVLPPKLVPEAATVLDGDTNSRLELNRSFAVTEDGLVSWFVDENIHRVKYLDYAR